MKKFRELAFYAGVFVVAAIFLNSCHSDAKNSSSLSAKYSKEEKVWLTKFFQDLLLRETSIYTLWGSKPMTLITISHYTDEEVQDYYNQLSPEEKQNVLVVEYDLDENWDRWEKIKDRFPQNRFLLFRRDMTPDEKISNVYLVDTLQTALVIQENYASFRNVVGFDFDPIKVVSEIQNLDSEFWNIALNHSALHGILFGFGAKNAWAFQWKYWSKAPCLKGFHSEDSDSPLYKSVSMSNFPIPTFVVFNDREVVGKYKKEREEIRKIYKGKDFVDTTLQRLTE